MHLSIDVGGSYIKYAWIDENHQIIKKGKKSTPQGKLEDFIAVIKSIWNEVEHNKSGVSFSLPGTIDPKSGQVHQGGSLLYHHGVNFKEIYERELNTKVSVENDARCAALAELKTGNMKNVEKGLVLTFGTGVGGGVILNGEVYRGNQLFAGEVSTWLLDDPQKVGSEAFLGNKLSMVNFVAKVKEAKAMEEGEGPEVLKLVEAGDAIANKHFDQFIKDIGSQVFNMQILLDPQRICIGGGVSENPLFVKRIQEEVTSIYKLFPFAMPEVEIMACKYHNDANIWGAYYHFLNEYK